MWGAYGKPPDDAASKTVTYDGPPPAQFNLVHGVRVSGDGKVYVADRRNNRMQVFTTAGVFEREIFVERHDEAAGHGVRGGVLAGSRRSDGCISPTPATARCVIYDRATLPRWAAIGRIGRYAGQFIFLHALAVDSQRRISTRPKSAPAGACRSS